MRSYVALLRGINVGGVRVAMAQLRAALTADFDGVSTYLQSGNVILQAPASSGEAELAGRVRALVARGTGIDTDVVVCAAQQWQQIVAANPFPVQDPRAVHAIVAQQPYTTQQQEAAAAICAAAAVAGEDLAIDGQALYLYTPAGLSRSRLAATLGRSAAAGQRSATARNWRSVLAIADLLAA